MKQTDHLTKPKLAARFERTALPLGVATLSIALVGPVLPLPLGIPMTVTGLALFATAALISCYVMFTKEMKSAQELGFDRTRDALIYANSAAGMDWRIVGLSGVAFAATFIIGFGLIGTPSSGGALLSFATSAYLSAIARLQRKWPSDDQRDVS